MALQGRRVLDLAGASGAYCAKLLADMGAEVIKVEPPGGEPGRFRPPFLRVDGDPAGASTSPLRSLPFLYMNTSKKSVVLDLESPGDADRFRELAAGADLVIESLAPGALDRLGIGWAALSAENPGLVLTSITGFGQTGPWRDRRSGDLVASAMGSAMASIGMPEDPPVRLAGDQSDVITAACAAAASLIALRHSVRTGEGQHVDISSLETVAAITHISGVGNWLEDGIVPRRAGTGLVAAVPSGAYPCKDGYAYLMVNRAAHWQALAEWIHETTGNEEVLQEVFHGPSSARLPYRELLDLFISDHTSQFTVQEIYHEGQRRHIAFTPVSDAATVAADEHLHVRSFFQEVEVEGGRRVPFPGAPFRPEKTPWRIRHAAPAPGEHDGEILDAPRRVPDRPEPIAPHPGGALGGLRIVEFGTGMAGPWIGRFMAWCGAEVVKVESVNHPDVPRLFVPPRNPELGTQPECSPWFTDWNAGKRCVALDLRKPEGSALCRRLIESADVVVSNYSTGVLDKLGLGYEVLRASNPDLVMLNSNGYGEFGPQAKYVTWGPNIEALSGLSGLSGFPGRECTMTHFAYPDPLSALHGLFAILCALDHRDRGGGGQAISQSQYETTVASIGQVMLEGLANGEEPEKLGNGSLYAAPQGCYPCAGDDRWVVLTVEDEGEWRQLCELMGDPEWSREERFATLAARLANREALDERLAGWTADQDDYALMDRLQGAGLAAGVVQTAADLFERDPQLRARGFFEEIRHFKKGTVWASGIPLGLTGTPGRTPFSGSSVGHDNEYVLREIVGLDEAEYDALVALGAIEVPGG